MSKIILEEQVAPDTPASDKVVLYPKAGGGLYVKNDAGDEATLGGIANVVEDTTPQLGGMLDVNGQAIGDGTLELLKFSETGSAVNEITIKNAATTNPPEIQATGDDTNIDVKIVPKGTGSILLGEYVIQLDATLSADNKYSGVTCDGVIGYASAAYGELVFLDNTVDRWEKTDANDEAKSGDVMLGLIVSSGASDGNACVILLYGFMREDTWTFTSAGDALYVSAAGTAAMVATAPAGASDIIRVVGYAGVEGSGHTVFFNPSKSWIELAA